jgi:hypothetical protein
MHLTRGDVGKSGVHQHGDRLHRWTWLLLDTAIWFVAVYGAAWLRLGLPSPSALVRADPGFAAAASLTYLVVGAVIGPYPVGHRRTPVDDTIDLGGTVLVTAAGLLVWALSVSPQLVPASVPVVAGALAFVGMFTARFLVRGWRGHQAAGGERPVLTPGTEETPLLERKSVLIGLLTAGFVIADASAAARRVTTTTSPVTPPTQPRSTSSVGAGASVMSYGAVGDGVTDDTASINAAIAANPGRVLHFPAGRIYQIRADFGAGADHGGGIRLDRPGTVLSMYGATIRMSASNMAHYQIIDVTAPDCEIRGGRVIGDVLSHAGTTGEWGHGVSIGRGADRFAARDVYVTHCWGDGFFIWERPSDVSLTNCTGDDNRRQGLSIIDAIRPRVQDGRYINNGRTRYTSPGGGVDLEPDHGTARDVIDAVITGVTLAGNRGPGLWSSSNGRTLTATITACRAIGNGLGGTDSGFLVDGTGNRTAFSSCESDGNSQDGWTIGALAANTRLDDCSAKLNGRYGIIDYGTGTQITRGRAALSRRRGSGPAPA